MLPTTVFHALIMLQGLTAGFVVTYGGLNVFVLDRDDLTVRYVLWCSFAFTVFLFVSACLVGLLT